MHPIDDLGRPLAFILLAVAGGYYLGLGLRTWWFHRHEPAPAWRAALDALRSLVDDPPAGPERTKLTVVRRSPR